MRRRERGWSWWSEASGAIGDLGVTLPLASALVITAGYPSARLFLLWGLVYVATGAWFRVPVSVQPLKAMAVIAIGTGVSAAALSTTAVGYGLLFLLLGVSGLVDRIRGWFSPALIRGIQLGIGLILLHKAWALTWEGPWILGQGDRAGPAGIAVCVAAIGALLLAGVSRRVWISLPVFVIGAGAGVVVAGWPGTPDTPTTAVVWSWPDWSLLPSLFVVLMLPQLPLTLGNAVVAAADACHHYWPARSERVSARSLATSIGLTNVVLGLLGGFPVCHGAGGIAAHARLGGRTGRTTMLLGLAFVAAALLPVGAALLLRIPVPLLGALLAVVGGEMVRLLQTLERRSELAVAVVVGGSSFATRNLAVGLAAGWVVESLLRAARRRRLASTAPPPPRASQKPQSLRGR